ncbi:peptidase domain-containing ABC transporter [Desulfobacter sp.]|uniref:peptidase domain-containing ABC transporter n=1 Tax=Desulfobacter sp. TaxID=2294 RepID=UPI003D0CDCD9
MTEQPGVVSAEQEQVPLVLTVPITPLVLGRLMRKNGISVSPVTLAKSCDAFQPKGARIRPVERLTGILNGLEHRQLRACQLRWDRMDRRQLPALVFHNGQWAYVEPATEDKVSLTPPGGPDYHLDPDALAQSPVLWFRGPGKTARTNSGEKGRATSLVMQELWKDKRWFFEMAAATVVINILAVASSLFAMQVYDRVVPTFAYSTLTALVAVMAIIICLDWSLKFIRARITDSLAHQADISISRQLFDHIMNLRLDTRPNSLGALAAHMKGLEQARNFFSSSIIFFMTDLPFCFFFLGVIYIIGGRVAFVYAFLLPIALVLGGLAQWRLRRLARMEVQKGQERQGLLLESIQGAETIKATGSTWKFSDHWQQLTHTMAGYGFKNKSITTTTMVTTGSLATIGYVGAMVVGVTQMELGELTTGGLIACAILGGRIIAPVAQSVRFMVQWEHVREGLEMVNRLLAMETDRRQDQETLFPDYLPDQVDLEGVRFSYPNSPIVSIDIPTLSFKAGDRALILGPNGCGKSTFLKILAGLFKPSEGQVRLGRTDISELDIQVINQRVGYLPQDVHLFKGTLKTNMALSGGVPDALVVEVAQLLGIDRVAAENPRSMDLEIFEGGSGLSGGQKQLVALSRIFMARPRVWLLDEPSAFLDLESENQVMNALKQWVRPTDIVIIATHRPRLSNMANRVLVMRRGRIVADGKPDEVIRIPGFRQQANLPVDRS